MGSIVLRSSVPNKVSIHLMVHKIIPKIPSSLETHRFLPYKYCGGWNCLMNIAAIHLLSLLPWFTFSPTFISKMESHSQRSTPSKAKRKGILFCSQCFSLLFYFTVTLFSIFNTSGKNLLSLHCHIHAIYNIILFKKKIWSIQHQQYLTCIWLHQVGFHVRYISYMKNMKMQPRPFFIDLDY